MVYNEPTTEGLDSMTQPVDQSRYTNTGARPAIETVQVYVSDLVTSVQRARFRITG